MDDNEGALEETEVEAQGVKVDPPEPWVQRWAELVQRSPQMSKAQFWRIPWLLVRGNSKD